MAIDVLFVSYGGGHVAMLEPLYRRALEDYSAAFLALTTARDYLEQRNLPAFGFVDLAEGQSADTIRVARRALGAGPLGSVVSEAETLAYHGLNLRELASQQGEDEALALFRQKGRQCFLPVATMVRLLEELRPKLILATNSPRTERAVFLAAKKLGIPRICLVDLFALQEYVWICEEGFADRVLVLNASVRDMFIKNGMEPERVFVTGNPAFDSLSATSTRKEGALIRLQWNLPANAKVVLWAAQDEPEAHPVTNAPGDVTLPSRIESELRRIIANQPDWYLVIRHHPSQKATFVPQERVIHSPKAQSVQGLIHALDAVVVMTSTVGIEASIAGKPVISVDLSVFVSDSPLSARGISRGVSRIEDIEVELEQAFRRQPDDLLIGQPTEAATSKVFWHIRNMLKRAA